MGNIFTIYRHFAEEISQLNRLKKKSFIIEREKTEVKDFLMKKLFEKISWPRASLAEGSSIMREN